jgi:hypothetical protein
MSTVNTTEEEEFATEVAKYIIGKRNPEITASELEVIAQKLGYEDIDRMINYVTSAEGKTFFKKAIRQELWQAGYRPKGWEL